MCVAVVVLLIRASSVNGTKTKPGATVTICRLRPAVSVAGWEYNVFTDLSLVDCAFAKNGVLLEGFLYTACRIPGVGQCICMVVSYHFKVCAYQ